MNVVKVITTDPDDPDFKAQLIRDIILLKGQWDLFLHADSQLSQDIVYALQLEVTGKEPTICLSYTTTGEWPAGEPDGVPLVKRDLHVETAPGVLDPNPAVGYFLKPQGRFGPSLTQQYLNRAYPKGRGVSNMLIKLTWG